MWSMDQDEPLKQVAGLLRQRNAIDNEIASIIQRPMTSGHLGEWVASQIFDIELEVLANEPGFDGKFKSGPCEARQSTSSGTSSEKGCWIPRKPRHLTITSSLLARSHRQYPHALAS